MKFALFALLFCIPTFAESVDNANAWFMYFGDHPIAKSKWGVHLEGQWRRADMGTAWQQLMLRPAVNYQLNKKISLSGGYGFVDTFPYGDAPVAAKFPEHRLFEQVIVNQRIKKLDFQNRFRLEQRNLGTMARQPDGSFERIGWRYENRVRYMLRTNIPLSKKNYIGLYNEIMFNFGKNVANNVFDQNRAYIAYGREFGRDTRLELGFLEQTLQQRSGLIENNHTLQIAIYSKIPFFGLR